MDPISPTSKKHQKPPEPPISKLSAFFITAIFSGMSYQVLPKGIRGVVSVLIFGGGISYCLGANYECIQRLIASIFGSGGGGNGGSSGGGSFSPSYYNNSSDTTINIDNSTTPYNPYSQPYTPTFPTTYTPTFPTTYTPSSTTYTPSSTHSTQTYNQQPTKKHNPGW